LRTLAKPDYLSSGRCSTGLDQVQKAGSSIARRFTIAKYFVDSNLLIYAGDLSEPLKQKISRELLDALLASRNACISTQVLQEFAHVLLQKMKLSANSVYAATKAMDGFELFQISRETILLAIDIFQSTSLSFWDAMIVAAAKSAGSSILLTEDFSHGQTIAGVRIHNPFIEMPKL
jgi:predicted nucleic acid-binding protein